MTTKVDAENIDRKSNNLVVMAAYFALDFKHKAVFFTLACFL